MVMKQVEENEPEARLTEGNMSSALEKQNKCQQVSIQALQWLSPLGNL